MDGLGSHYRAGDRPADGAGRRQRVHYLHGDHLGSVSAATDQSGAVASRQEYTPWGEVRAGGIGETALNYTGQRKDGTGLLCYNPTARTED